MNAKTIFAAAIVVAILGAAIIQIEGATAGKKTFKTVHRADDFLFAPDDNKCNEAYGGDGANCEMCAGTAANLGYKNEDMKCSKKAFEDCGDAPPCCKNDGNNGDTNCPDWING